MRHQAVEGRKPVVYQCFSFKNLHAVVAVALLLLVLGAPRPVLCGEACFHDIEALKDPGVDAVRQFLPAFRDGRACGECLALCDKLFSCDDKTRGLFLTLGNGRGPAVVTMGLARGFKKALESAINTCRMRYSRLYSGIRPSWAQIDMVSRIGFMDRVAVGQPTPFDPGTEGIAFAPGEFNSSGLTYPPAFPPGLCLARSFFTREHGLNRNSVTVWWLYQGGGRAQLDFLESKNRFVVYRFRTCAYCVEDDYVHRVFRGHRVVQSVDIKELKRRVKSSSAYLARAVGKDGRFDYLYRARKNSCADSYNIVRHAGTLFSMIDAWRLTGDENLRAACERAAAYLKSRTLPWPPKAPGDAQGGPDAKSVSQGVGPGRASPGQLCIVEKRKIKLGAAALAVVAFVEYGKAFGEDTYADTARRLGRYILKAQKPSGEFVYQRRYPGGEERDFVSMYYPGEAILALCRLYSEDRNQRWLACAEKAADWLINVRDKGKSIRSLLHDHWLLYALNELHGFNAHPMYVEHTMKIVRAMKLSQKTAPPAPDHLGGFYSPPRATPTATRSEGLLAAYRLIRGVGRYGEAAGILDTAALAVIFQLQMHFDACAAMHMPLPSRCLGGVRESLVGYDVRIDYVQHSMSALLAAIRIMSRENIRLLPRPGSPAEKLVADNWRLWTGS